jgi:hypothetical protein
MHFEHIAIITGRRAAGWSQSMAAEIRNGLERNGVPVQLVEIERLEEFCAGTDAQDPSTLILDFNHRIVFPWQRPMISIMLDHPCSLTKELAAKHSEHAVTAWVDASHPAAVRAFGFPHRATFLPHAGPEVTGNAAPADERDIDIFFSGSLGEPLDRAGWQAANPGVSPVVPHLLFDTIDLIETTGAPVLPALLKIMGQHGIAPASLTRDNFAELMAMILKIGEVNRRVSILTALPEDIRVVVASDYLPLMLRDRANVRHVGYVDDFDEIRAYMRRSRIVLNATSKFPGGSHERIWFAMAEGAVVLTDSSVFMKQDFQDGETILYLPQKHLRTEDFALVVAVAKDNLKCRRMAESALSLYRERHSWTKRAQLLIETMRAA